jgi:ribosomal protein L3 glutamine methyltransferase
MARAARTVRALLEEAVERFERAGLAFGHGTDNALDEAAWIILRALELPLDSINAHLDDVLDEARWKTARELIDKRIRTRKPAAYLLNEAWLGKHRFYVDERVIVPRSFIGELLLDRHPGKARHPGEGRDPISILDLCTGSGCLAIVAALRFPGSQVDAADISEDALAVAARNVAAYALQDRVRLVQSDLFSNLQGRTYDVIVSNPPYVKSASMRKLPEEYRREPELALASGVDGLDHTRAILAQAPRHLNPGGRLMVEIGHNRKALERAYPNLPFEWPQTASGAGFVFTLRREALPGCARA